MRSGGRLSVMVAAMALMTCHAHAYRPAQDAHPEGSPRAAAQDRFDPAVVAPSDAVQSVREALEAGAAERARRLARQAASDAGPDEAPRLRWLEARAALAEGEPREALPPLRAVADADHPLSRWASLRLAELHEEADPEAAARTAARLTTDRWAGRDRARTIEARALAAAGRAEDAIPKLRALVAEVPDHVGAASAGMPLAELLAERGAEPEALEEALGLYRRVATRAPLTRAGRDAEARARAVLARLPAERRTALAELPADDAFARAHAMYGSMRHEQAERAFRALARRFADDPARRCDAELFQGKALLRQRKRAEGAKLLAGVAERCTDLDVRARARFLTARAHARRGENADAIRHYAVVEEEAPAHRLADDALFRAALAAGDDGDTEGMVRRLQALPGRYPDGDMKPEARFLLARRARAEQRWDEALRHFDGLLADGPAHAPEGAQGRAAYWRARTLEDAGRTGEAARAHAAVVRSWPLSYHAQQSLSRLAELDEDRATDLRSRFAAEGAKAHLRFAHRPELEEPAFRRALELLRVGEVDRAMEELRHLGAVGAGADDDLLWLVAAVLDRAGAHPEASRLVRTRLHSFRRTIPTGRARLLWRLAYPRAFAPLIERVADEMGVPASFVRAVAREETAFDPHAVSVAGARGLIQLMEPTARRFAAKLGIEVTAAALHDPEVNVRVGTGFIRYLFQRFGDNPAVVPAAYNAGEGAARRWLRARGDLPLDAWIEEIPYDETRRYTRRVVETWGVYRFLDDNELPTLASALPAP
ncbi:MAG: transglycosylase SLT domain-containing protein [Myxococcota bacterium]